MDVQAVGGIQRGADPGAGVIRHVGLPRQLCGFFHARVFITFCVWARVHRTGGTDGGYPGASAVFGLLPVPQSTAPIPRRTRIAVPMRVMSTSLSNRAAMGSSSVSSFFMWAA